MSVLSYAYQDIAPRGSRYVAPIEAGLAGASNRALYAARSYFFELAFRFPNTRTHRTFGQAWLR